MAPVETGDLNLVTANEDGKFEYDLNGRKIVHNQEIEVTSSSMDGLYDEEDEEVEESSTEKASVEEESTDAKATYTTPRYEKAYEIPEKQLEEKMDITKFSLNLLLKDQALLKVILL